MMNRLTYASAIISLFSSASCVAVPQDRIIKELCASTNHKLIEIKLNTIIEEDDYSFFFDKKTNVKYGETISAKSAFVSTEEHYFFIKEMTFAKADGSSETKFDDRDLLMQQATLYKYKDHSVTKMCLVSNFAGLGQSGNYQKYQWAISFPKDATSISQLHGRFGK
jgi:hypothetical protein